jgi:hypothetical protein
MLYKFPQYKEMPENGSYFTVAVWIKQKQIITQVLASSSSQKIPTKAPLKDLKKDGATEGAKSTQDGATGGAKSTQDGATGGAESTREGVIGGAGPIDNSTEDNAEFEELIEQRLKDIRSGEYKFSKNPTHLHHFKYENYKIVWLTSSGKVDIRVVIDIAILIMISRPSSYSGFACYLSGSSLYQI